MERELLVSILAGGIVLRTILDLTTLNRSSRLIDILYVTLYGVVGGVILLNDHSDIFGYACVIIAAGWGLHAVFRSKNR